MKISTDDIRAILVDVFPNSKIPEEIINLKINDFDEWDSLGNFNLLLGIEDKFKIRFDISEMAELNTIISIIASLENKYID